MVQVQQRILIGVWLVSAAWGSAAYAERFHDDDPIAKVPPPRRVESARVRAISDFYDFFMNTFTQRGENHVPVAKTAAEAVNTLDEVPDSPWFENRHALRPMSREELQRGAGDGNPPSMDGPWKVISARSVRLTPGFTMEDARGRRYLVKLDSRDAPDMATSADVIGSRFFHALGYYTPENYIVHFSRSRLLLTPQLARQVHQANRTSPSSCCHRRRDRRRASASSSSASSSSTLRARAVGVGPVEADRARLLAGAGRAQQGGGAARDAVERALCLPCLGLLLGLQLGPAGQHLARLFLAFTSPNTCGWRRTSLATMPRATSSMPNAPPRGAARTGRRSAAADRPAPRGGRRRRPRASASTTS